MALAARTTARRGSALVGALFALTKPQLGFFSVLTTMAAYCTTTTRFEAAHASATVFGTALAAGGALSLNQWWERTPDCLMRRTRGRPLPSDAISPAVALGWSLVLSVAGVGFLALNVSVLAALIAAATIMIYGVVYTPLKRRTRWATEIGAISGALPPLIGSAAAGRVWSSGGATLAVVLLCWQMPHFFAIGWKYRADYRAAGFPLLPAIDATGVRTAAWSAGYSALLFMVSIVPYLLGYLGATYGIVAIVAGTIFLVCSWRFVIAKDSRDRAARELFFASLIYLPVMMTAVVIDAW